MEPLALVLVPCIVLYWCIGKASAEELRLVGEGISDIQTINIPSTATSVNFGSNNLGSSGIPGNYFVVSNIFSVMVSLIINYMLNMRPNSKQ